MAFIGVLRPARSAQLAEPPSPGHRRGSTRPQPVRGQEQMSAWCILDQQFSAQPDKVDQTRRAVAVIGDFEALDGGTDLIFATVAE